MSLKGGASPPCPKQSKATNNKGGASIFDVANGCAIPAASAPEPLFNESDLESWLNDVSPPVAPTVPPGPDPSLDYECSRNTKVKPGTVTMPIQKTAAKFKAKLKARAEKKGMDLSVRGRLLPIASSILMRILYAARMARFDLLKAVNKLACNIAYWDDDSDKRLNRLVA